MEDTTRIKLEINNLIWMYGQPELTLAAAEDLAVAMFDLWESAMRTTQPKETA